MALRVLWPEGEPDKAILTANLLKDWGLSFLWSWRAKRTLRMYSWIDGKSDPVLEARVAERIISNFKAGR